jgi:hypothetical protein
MSLNGRDRVESSAQCLDVSHDAVWHGKARLHIDCVARISLQT